MNVKEILKFFRNKNRAVKSASWIKKTLFKEFKEIAIPIIQENNLFTKKEMVYIHNFISDYDCLLITEEILQEVLRDLMRK